MPCFYYACDFVPTQYNSIWLRNYFFCFFTLSKLVNNFISKMTIHRHSTYLNSFNSIYVAYIRIFPRRPDTQCWRKIFTSFPCLHELILMIFTELSLNCENT